jgi:hypothetical protein
MICGDVSRFAIEAEALEATDGWLFGHFRFWLCGKAVGNWDDFADLRACISWLRDLSEHPRNRFEPLLIPLDPSEVFRVVYDPVMEGPAPGLPRVASPFARFHISHIGMSAFDRYDILLLKDALGGERCLWREAGRPTAIFECHLGENEMERVAAEFCERFGMQESGSGTEPGREP